MCPSRGAMRLRVDHIAIACRDVERMREWYERVLGFRVVFCKPPSQEPPRAGEQATYLAGPEGSYVTLELMPFDGEAAPGRKIFTMGISHIAFTVDDISSEEARLTSLGVAWLGDRAAATGGGSVRSFLDLEGNILQLVERPRSWRQ